jgi:hypothetical protein
MVDGFDVRPSRLGARPRRAAAPACGAALAMLLGCSGEPIIVAEERQMAGGGGAPDEGAVAGTGGETGIAVVEDCPLSPAERTELLGCWPTQHVGTWRGYFIGVARYETRDGAGEEFPPGYLVLHLDLDGTGHLTFTDGTSVDALDPCSGLALSGCSELGRLRMGFDYTLEDIQLVEPKLEGPLPPPGEPVLRAGESMSFQIRLGEPWNDLCPQPSPSLPSEAACESGACAKAAPGVHPDPAPAAEADDPACSCNALGCIVRAPSLRVSLRMSEDGNALRGAYEPDAGGISGARLEFLKERAP